jgi:cytochrome c biogenesis protein CcmG, thiol:disulfide interchange protein DsbE
MQRPVLAIVLSTVVLLASCSKAEPNAFPPCTPHGFTSPGEALPDCTFEGFNGWSPVRLAKLQGKPVVLNFWASWCIACITELPNFEKVWKSFNGRVTIVGMDVTGLQGETKGAGLTFARRAGVTYRLAYDPSGLLYAHFSPSRTRPIMPITVYVDGRGIVKERHFGGPLSEKELRDAIAQFLGVR